MQRRIPSLLARQQRLAPLLSILLCCCLYLANAATFNVGPSGNIQTALNSVTAPGDIVQLQGCNYTIRASSVNYTLPTPNCFGSIVNAEIAYLSFSNVTGISLVGRTNCPGQTVINFVQDSDAFQLPCGFNVRTDDITIQNVDIRFSIDTGTVTTPASCVYDVCFTTLQVCDVHCCDLTFGNGSLTNFFPTYTPLDIGNETNSGFRMSDSIFNFYTQPYHCAFFYVSSPLAICNASVNSNRFQNDNLTAMVARNSNNQLCSSPLGALDWRFNCYSNISQIYLFNPLIDAPIVYLPYSQCACRTPDFPNGVPTPLYSLNPLVVYASMLDAYNSNASVVYIGAGIVTLDQTIIIQRPFTIIGTVNNSCDCVNGLAVANDVNPAFLVINNLLAINDTSVTLGVGSGFAIYRASEALNSDAYAALTRFVPLVTPFFTQAYPTFPTNATPPSLTAVSLTRFSTPNATTDAVYALVILECGVWQRHCAVVITRSQFFNLPTAIFTRVGGTSIVKNYFSGTRQSLFMGGGPVFGGGAAIVLDYGAANANVQFNVFVDNLIAVQFTGGSASHVTCNEFVGDDVADVHFLCGGYTNEVCFNCTRYAPTIDHCLHVYFNNCTCTFLEEDFAECNNEVDETQFYETVGTCMADAGLPVNGTFLEFLHFVFYQQCISSTSFQYTSPLLTHYLANTNMSAANINYLLCLWITQSSFCDQYEIVPGSGANVSMVPDCTRSIGNYIDSNSHVTAAPYNHTGVVIPYGVQALSENHIELPLPHFLQFQNATPFAQITQLSLIVGVTDTIVLGLNQSCHSGSISRTFYNAPPVGYYESATYLDLAADCRPPKSFPQVLTTFDNFNAGGTNCSNCTIRFTMSAACFQARMPNTTSNATCASFSILGMSASQGWFQLPTTVSCNGSTLSWTTPCNSFYSMFVVGIVDPNVYVLCDYSTRTQFPLGATVVFSLRDALDIVPAGGTIYLSDGQCCCDECVVNKTVHITSYLQNNTCDYAMLSCCPDLAGNQCLGVLWFAQESHASSVSKIRFDHVWTDGRDNPLPHPGDYNEHARHGACALMIGCQIPAFSGDTTGSGPPPVFATQLDHYPTPIVNLLFKENFFTNSTCGISAQCTLNLTIERNAFGSGPTNCPDDTCCHGRRLSRREFTAPSNCLGMGVEYFGDGFSHSAQSCADNPVVTNEFVHIINNTFTDGDIGIFVANSDPFRKPGRLTCKPIDVEYLLRITNNTFTNPRVSAVQMHNVKFAPTKPATIASNSVLCPPSPSLANTQRFIAFASEQGQAGWALQNVQNGNFNDNFVQYCESYMNGKNLNYTYGVHRSAGLHFTNAAQRAFISHCPHLAQVTNITVTNSSFSQGSVLSHDHEPLMRGASGARLPNYRGIHRMLVVNPTLDQTSAINGFLDGPCSTLFTNILVTRCALTFSPLACYVEFYNATQYLWNHERAGETHFVVPGSTDCTPLTLTPPPTLSSSASSASSATSHSSTTAGDYGLGLYESIAPDAEPATNSSTSSSTTSSLFDDDDDTTTTIVVIAVIAGAFLIVLVILTAWFSCCARRQVAAESQNTFLNVSTSESQAQSQSQSQAHQYAPPTGYGYAYGYAQPPPMAPTVMGGSSHLSAADKSAIKFAKTH